MVRLEHNIFGFATDFFYMAKLHGLVPLIPFGAYCTYVHTNIQTLKLKAEEGTSVLQSRGFLLCACVFVCILFCPMHHIHLPFIYLYNVCSFVYVAQPKGIRGMH